VGLDAMTHSLIKGWIALPVPASIYLLIKTVVPASGSSSL
jgi:hypothetical protein